MKGRRDGSPECQDAIKEGIELAGRLNARCHLLAVGPLPDSYMENAQADIDSSFPCHARRQTVLLDSPPRPLGMAISLAPILQSGFRRGEGVVEKNAQDGRLASIGVGLCADSSPLNRRTKPLEDRLLRASLAPCFASMSTRCQHRPTEPTVFTRGNFNSLLLLRPCEVSSGIANAPVLEVAHHTLRVLLQHRHVVVRGFA